VVQVTMVVLDLALRSYLHLSQTHPCPCFAVALCCHNKCVWSQYLNPAFVQDVLGWGGREFRIASLMST
jgi:hypothetical protein